MSARELTVRDLVLAASDAERYVRAHEDLRAYFTKRYELMRSAIGLATDLRTADREDSEPSSSVSPDDAYALESVLRRTVKLLDEIPNPFREILEAPEVIGRLYQQHGPAIYGAGGDLHAALVDLAVDIVLLLEPDVAERSTNEATLHQLGLPINAPDPLDYW